MTTHAQAAGRVPASASASAPVRVVMLGGGYVSVMAYRVLYRRLRREVDQGRVQITIVAPDAYHSFHGWTGEVLGGVLPEGRQKGSLREICRRARLVGGTAVGIDLAARRIRVRLNDSADHHEVHYDHLVLGHGTQDDLGSVPGLAEHGWSLKERGGHPAVHNRLLSLLDRAEGLEEDQQRQQLLSVVIAGGGFAGVEMSAAIAELFGTLRGRYTVLREHKPRVVLVHSGEALLPEVCSRFSRLAVYASRQLAAYGVDVRLGTRLVRVDEDGGEISGGEHIPAAIVISTVGQRQTILPGTKPLPRGSSGRLQTDPRLYVRGHESVWSGGDAAEVAHPVTGQPCPPNALWAIKHGQLIGKNIAAVLRNRPPRAFTYRGLGQAASMGIGKGILELYGWQFCGWVAWISRLLFFLRFMPSRRQAARAVMDFALLPLLGRHTTPAGTAVGGPAGRTATFELEPAFHQEHA